MVMDTPRLHAILSQETWSLSAGFGPDPMRERTLLPDGDALAARLQHHHFRETIRDSGSLSAKRVKAASVVPCGPRKDKTEHIVGIGHYSARSRFTSSSRSRMRARWSSNVTMWRPVAGSCHSRRPSPHCMSSPSTLLRPCTVSWGNYSISIGS